VILEIQGNQDLSHSEAIEEPVTPWGDQVRLGQLRKVG